MGVMSSDRGAQGTPEPKDGAEAGLRVSGAGTALGALGRRELAGKRVERVERSRPGRGLRNMLFKDQGEKEVTGTPPRKLEGWSERRAAAGGRVGWELVAPIAGPSQAARSSGGSRGGPAGEPADLRRISHKTRMPFTLFLFLLFMGSCA